MRIYIPSSIESTLVLYCYDSNRKVLDLDTPEAIYDVTTTIFGDDYRKNGVPNDYKYGYNSNYPKGESCWRINVKCIADKTRFSSYVMEYLFKYGVRIYDGFIISANREQEFISLKPAKVNSTMKSTTLSVCQPRVAKIGSITTTYVVWFGSRRASDGSSIESYDGLHIDSKDVFTRDSKRVFAKDSDAIISKYNIDAQGCLPLISPECAIKVNVNRPEIMWGTSEEVEEQIRELIIEHLEEEGYITSSQEPTEKLKA